MDILTSYGFGSIRFNIALKQLYGVTPDTVSFGSIRFNIALKRYITIFEQGYSVLEAFDST
ncbi:hypothetical protein RT43_GL002043 [Enterococcus italicus DSM 15952]|nr:hypothetical protein RT43_GL002043 [Enterococcus italicus DSM 15952]